MVGPAARSLRLAQTRGATSATFLDWIRPAASGSAAPGFDVVRSENPADFGPTEPTAACLESGDAADTFAVDAENPAVLFAYIVVARNACGMDAGTDSGDLPRTVRTCP